MANQALRNQMNRVVRVARSKTLDLLKANREKHLQQYSEALNGYKGEALAKVNDEFSKLDGCIAEQKQKILSKVESFTPETVGEFSDAFTVYQGVVIHLEVPKCFVEAYDTAIAIFEQDVRDELDLSGAEFQCFCRDVWEWQEEFTMSTHKYLSK